MADALTVDIVDSKGKKTGSAELPAEIFDVETNIPLMHQVVVAQLAAARQGTHATKTRGAVRGGGRKPYRQKGTGRARQGSTRAPQFVGGGTVHGPQPRDYSQRTPKKMKAAALRSALSDRARNGRIHVITEFVTSEKPSTKSALGALRNITDRKALVVATRADELTALSLRNAPEALVIWADQLNTYDVVNARTIVFSQAGLDAFVGARSASTQALAAEPEVPETNVADQHPYGEDSFRGDNPPAGFDIKGNEDSKKFHAPTSPWYGRTIAEVWFRSAEAAEAAGFVNAVKSDSDKEDAK